MKKLFLLFAIAPLLFSCSDDDDNNNVVLEPIDNPTRLVSVGENVSNPTNSQWCKDPQADATLTSLRCVSDRLYWMNYKADLHLKELADGNYRTRDDFENAFSELMFTPEGYEPAQTKAPSACSGFVCHNPEGELLMGRNFDGAHGPMLFIFNRDNGYKFIQCTAPNYNSALYYNEISGDGILSDGKTSLHRLMRVPLSTMDGMNEYGLCFAAYQLPSFDKTPEITPLNQNTGKKAISSSLFHSLALSTCKTVKEVEELLKSYDMININPSLNIHWMFSDATGDWAIFEYWENQLYIMRETELYLSALARGIEIPYEWYSIENYYRNIFAYTAYPTTVTSDPTDWQIKMSCKIRVSHMMQAYKPVMTEKEAMKCLQEGRYDLEVPNDFTNWSCIYNPTQRTVTFTMRNDMSKAFTVDLKKDL